MPEDKKAPWKVGEDRWSGFSRRQGHVVYRETSSGRVEVASFVKKEDAELAAKLVNADFGKAEAPLLYKLGLLLGKARLVIDSLARSLPEGSKQRKLLQEWITEVDDICLSDVPADTKKEVEPDEG